MITVVRFVTAGLGLFLAASGFAQDTAAGPFPRAKAEPVGLSSEKLQGAVEASGIIQHVLVGAVISENDPPMLVILESDPGATVGAGSKYSLGALDLVSV